MSEFDLNKALEKDLITRRELLRTAGRGAGAFSLAAFLTACGVGGTKGKEVTDEQAASIWDNATKNGVLSFANWPLYIDQKKVNGKVIHPSLDRFEKDTGIEVTYKEPVNENETFFSTIQPSLAAGKPTGYDIVVLTNGATLSKMIRLNYLTPLEHSYLKNFEQYAAPKYKDPSYDPGNEYTVPWQSGITGIGYNPKLTGREITSFNDLLDPAFKGKVGMFGDTLDLPNFAMAGMGVNPETSTPDDWTAAADMLTKQRDDGIVRQYYQQNYIKALSSGDVWLTMAWSGDVFQAQNSGSPDLKFVVPDEGGILWTDNMCIPAHAENPVDAITMMDYVYQPEIAAIIADWVWYITPVPAAQEIIANDLKDKAVAESPLVFPTEEMYNSTYRYRVLTTEEEQEWNATFEPIYQS
jgi:spermidine/putrescine transport system substrate-binding protein